MNKNELDIQLALGSLSYDDKIKLVKNKRTSKKILTILSKDENSYVRANVADNPNTPKEMLKKLSKNKNWGVRHRARAQLNDD